MATILYLAAVAACWWWGSTNGLLAIACVALLEMALAAVRIRDGLADLYRLASAPPMPPVTLEPARDEGQQAAPVTIRPARPDVEIAPGVVGWWQAPGGPQ